jgi:agmatine deiminase
MKTTSAADTPAALGYAMPTGWEPHAATWLGWSHHETDSPDKVNTNRWVFGKMVRELTRGEAVRLLVNDRAAERPARLGVGETCRPA